MVNSRRLYRWVNAGQAYEEAPPCCGASFSSSSSLPPLASVASAILGPAASRRGLSDGSAVSSSIVLAGGGSELAFIGSPIIFYASRATSSAVIVPNPAIAEGSLKSQPFSTRPTKSLIAGSEDQARRSAARV